VLSGLEVAGPHVRDACKRHLRDLETGAARGLHFDRQAADRVFRYFRTVLKLNDGQFEDRPFELHPSQQFIVGSVFGWKRADGTRRFQRAYVEQGKGNGKSPMVAGIGLYGMAADGEPGAQIYSAGSTKDQAKVLFSDAVKMADKAPALKKRITFSGIAPNVWNMAILGAPQKVAFFKPVSRDTKKSGSGPRPHMALIDELHEHPDRGTMETLERGFKFRRQPLLFMITNSGTDKNSVCWEEHEHAVKVARGDIEDDTTFSYVCAMDEDDDPINDPSCWKKANPLLGVILTHDYLARVVAQAKALPGKRNGILRLHFCVWTGADKAWIAPETWEACEDPNLRLEDFAGRRCVGGLDLSATKDLTAKALVFEDGEADDGKPTYVAFVHGYTPADTLRFAPSWTRRLMTSGSSKAFSRPRQARLCGTTSSPPTWSKTNKPSTLCRLRTIGTLSSISKLPLASSARCCRSWSTAKASRNAAGASPIAIWRMNTFRRRYGCQVQSKASRRLFSKSASAFTSITRSGRRCRARASIRRRRP
jgi:phage terminase large subunit-like protein